jgi:hypothetical protein
VPPCTIIIIIIIIIIIYVLLYVILHFLTSPKKVLKFLEVNFQISLFTDVNCAIASFAHDIHSFYLRLITGDSQSVTFQFQETQTNSFLPIRAHSFKAVRGVESLVHSPLFAIVVLHANSADLSQRGISGGSCLFHCNLKWERNMLIMMAQILLLCRLTQVRRNRQSHWQRWSKEGDVNLMALDC